MSAAWLLLSAAAALSLPQLPDHDCIEVPFVQTRQLPALDAPLTLEGHMRVAHGRSFAWQVSTPYAYRYEVEGGRVTEVLPDGSRRQTPLSSVPGVAATSELFRALVRGRIAPLERHFSISRGAGGDDRQRLELKPDSAPMDTVLQRVRVEYGQWLQLLVIEGIDGSRSRIEFGAPSACGDAGSN